MNVDRGKLGRCGLLVLAAYAGPSVGLICFKGPDLEARMLEPLSIFMSPAMILFVPGLNLIAFLTAWLAVLFVVKKGSLWVAAALGATWGALTYMGCLAWRTA